MHRFGGTMISLAGAMTDHSDDDGSSRDSQPSFMTTVRLVSGRLPGSAPASAQASQEAGPRPWDRIRLSTPARSAIQMAAAAAVAATAGSALSERRVYWALIAVFVVFLGVNNTREQVAKALFRSLGTLVSVVLGSVLAVIVGTHGNWAIAVVLLALLLGFYFLQINYAFFAVGLTVAFPRSIHSWANSATDCCSCAWRRPSSAPRQPRSPCWSSASDPADRGERSPSARPLDPCRVPPSAACTHPRRADSPRVSGHRCRRAGRRPAWVSLGR